MNPETIFVVGGSAGLGKEISKVLAAQGANITIFARNQKTLEGAKHEISSAQRSQDQTVEAVAVDMSISSKARAVLESQPKLPDTLYCVAGGTANELGFLVDLEPVQIERCMSNNYHSSVYPAQSVLKLWIEDDKTSVEIPAKPKKRKIIFVNSTASLIPAPGYIAYSAAKAAQRALADTLRMEVLRYNNPKSTYIVQCVFAHNFITPTFVEEQKNKPALTKRLEGTTGEIEDLNKNDFPYAETLAPEIVAESAKDEFAVMDGRFEPQIVWATSIGSSPKRGWGIWDTVLAVVSSVVWPFIRRRWEKECEGDAYRHAEKEKDL